MNTTRNGKIARLPRDVREELNRRLDNNTPGGPLLAWLNDRPDVRSVLTEQFAGVPVSKQNLSEWRAGGFADWQCRRDWQADGEELAADAGDVVRAIPQRLADALATVVTGRYASVVHRWNGEVTKEFERKLRVLRVMCQDVTRLRRGEHSAAKLKIEEGWLEEAREKTEAEVVAKFEAWAKNKDVHDWLVKTWVSPKERERRKREMLGYPPLEEEAEVQGLKSKVEDGPSNGGKSNDQNPNSKVEDGKSKVQNPNFKEKSNSKIQGANSSKLGQRGGDNLSVASVPPHPGPLPEGEGELSAVVQPTDDHLGDTAPAGQGESNPVKPLTEAEGGKSKIQKTKAKVEGGKFNDQYLKSKENSNFNAQGANPVRVGPGESSLGAKDGGVPKFQESPAQVVDDAWVAQVPPHPGPLPEGEGELSAGARQTNGGFGRTGPAGQGESNPVKPLTETPGAWDRLPANIPRPCDGPCRPGPEGYCLNCFWKPGEIEQPAENLRGEFIGLFGQVLEARRRVQELAQTTRPPEPPAPPIASPCVGICQRDQGGHCRGCGRSIPEILRWPTMSEAEKAQVTRHLAERRAKLGGGAV